MVSVVSDVDDTIQEADLAEDIVMDGETCKNCVHLCDNKMCALNKKCV